MQKSAIIVAPGFEYRIHPKLGVHSVLEVKGDNAIVRSPGGEILKGVVGDIISSIERKELIPEPILKPRVITSRVWIHSRKKMVYGIAGIVKKGSDWYQIYTSPSNHLRVHEKDMVIMHDTAMVSLTGDLLFEYDVVRDIAEPNDYRIVFYNGPLYTAKSIGKKYQSIVTPHKYERCGNIFEQPDYYDLFVKSNL